MWAEFVVSSRPCSKGFSPGPPVFPPSSKTNISKFQFEEATGVLITHDCYCKCPDLFILLFTHQPFRQKLKSSHPGSLFPYTISFSLNF